MFHYFAHLWEKKEMFEIHAAKFQKHTTAKMLNSSLCFKVKLQKYSILNSTKQYPSLCKMLLSFKLHIPCL